MAELTRLLEELDQVFERIVTLMAERHEWQGVLSKRTREGHIALARTRLALPIHSLAPLHYPPNMHARQRLLVSDWRLERGGGAPDDEELRDGDRPAPEEPLHWFTALPPATLRQAQKEFEIALEATVKLVKNAEELRREETRWMDLKQKKQQLLSHLPQ